MLANNVDPEQTPRSALWDVWCGSKLFAYPKIGDARQYEPRREKTCLRGFRPESAQLQKLGRGLKIRILKLEVLYYLGSEH